jgi:hypothetical protein
MPVDGLGLGLGLGDGEGVGLGDGVGVGDGDGVAEGGGEMGGDSPAPVAMQPEVSAAVARSSDQAARVRGFTDIRFLTRGDWDWG